MQGPSKFTSLKPKKENFTENVFYTYLKKPISQTKKVVALI